MLKFQFHGKNLFLILTALLFSSFLLFHFADASTTITHNYNAGTTTGWSGVLWAQEFKNLFAFAKTNQLALNVTATGSGHVRVKFYDNAGTIWHTAIPIHNNQASTTSNTVGNLIGEEFTGLTAGGTINTAGINFVSVGGFSTLAFYDDTGLFQHQIKTNVCSSCTGTAINIAGNIFLDKFTGLPAGKKIVGLCPVSPAGTDCAGGSTWGEIKIYQQNSTGEPHTLVGQTGVITGNGISSGLNLGTIPSDGVVWAGMIWNNTAGVGYSGVAGARGCASSFQSGPNPVLNCTDPTLKISFNLYYNDVNGTGMAGSKLGQVTVTPSGGIYEFAFQPSTTVKIPNDGNIWMFWDYNGTGTSTTVKYSGLPAFSFPETFLSNPSTFPIWTNANNVTVAPYMDIHYFDHSISSGPLNLLGETGSITINSTGINNFPLAVTIPSDGNLWATMETDSGTFAQKFNSTTATEYSFTHSYGAGPTTLGTTYTNQSSTEWTRLTYTVINSTVAFKMLLNDGSALIPTGTVIAYQNNAKVQSVTVNGTGWATFPSLANGNYNFTFIDGANTFAVYKLLNDNINANVAQTINTWEMPKNCISGTTGYQSDFVIQINDTDGTHITNFTPIKCVNQNQLLFNVTYTGNGISSSTFSSLMRSSVGTDYYALNPKNFTVNNVIVPTSFTQGHNILSNAFTVGSGKATTTLNFVINLAINSVVQSVGSGSPPSVCVSNPFDPSCSQNPPNQCQYGSNSQGICVFPIPSTCPYGQNSDGTCVNASPVCPYGTYPDGGCIIPSQQCPDGKNSDGTCFTPLPNQCPYGTNPDGSCANPPPNPNPNPTNQANTTINNILNGLFGGGGGGSVTIQGITYKPTSDILLLGQIKNEAIGVSWQSPSNLNVERIFIGNSSLGMNLTPFPPYNITGSTSGQSSGQINYIVTVPPNFCSDTITSTCIDPNKSTFTVPISITVALNGKEVQNTLNLSFTILKQQDIATITIFALVGFAVLGMGISSYVNRARKKAKKSNRFINNKKSSENRQYLSKK